MLLMFTAKGRAEQWRDVGWWHLRREAVFVLAPSVSILETSKNKTLGSQAFAQRPKVSQVLPGIKRQGVSLRQSVVIGVTSCSSDENDMGIICATAHSHSRSIL